MGTILLNGPLQISKPDTPPVAGSVVETMEQLMALENPYVGQQVYVRQEGKTYTVRSLKPRDVGGLTIENGAVDRVTDIFEEIDVERRVYYNGEEEQIVLFEK